MHTRKVHSLDGFRVKEPMSTTASASCHLRGPLLLLLLLRKWLLFGRDLHTMSTPGFTYGFLAVLRNRKSVGFRKDKAIGCRDWGSMVGYIYGFLNCIVCALRYFLNSYKIMRVCVYLMRKQSVFRSNVCSEMRS